MLYVFIDIRLPEKFNPTLKKYTFPLFGMQFSFRLTTRQLWDGVRGQIVRPKAERRAELMLM